MIPSRGIVGGRTCHPCSMYVSGRCHKDATPRVAPACHAMPRHAKQCGYFLIMQSENYSTNNPLPPLILHLHQSLSTAFARSQSEARYASLAPLARRQLYLSYRRCCISTPLFRAAPTSYGQQACRRHRFSWSGAWRGEGLGVLWDVEVSRAVLFRCLRGDWGCNGSARSLRVRMSDWAPRDMASLTVGRELTGGWMAASRW